jgi:hypothetical protein
VKATYEWADRHVRRAVEFVRVEGTNGHPFRFGEDQDARDIEVQEFYIATTPVTQSFWTHVMGPSPPSNGNGPMQPVENVSWDDLVRPGGFLQRLRDSNSGRALLAQASLVGRERFSGGVAGGADRLCRTPRRAYSTTTLFFTEQRMSATALPDTREGRR